MEIKYNRKQYAEFLRKAYRLNRIIEPLEKTPYVRIFIDASDSEHVVISSTHTNGIVYSRHLDCVVKRVSDNPNSIFTLKQTLNPIYEKLMLESDDPYYTVSLFPRLSLSNNIMEALPYYKDSTQITNSAETYRIQIDSIPLIYTVFGESDNESIKVLSLPSKYHLMAFQAGSETLYVPQHTKGQIRPRQCTMAGNEYKIHCDLPFKR